MVTKKTDVMPWAEVAHFIAQGAVNVTEGHTTIEPRSKVHRAMIDFCEHNLQRETTARALLDRLEIVSRAMVSKSRGDLANGTRAMAEIEEFVRAIAGAT